jgi:hypothetical protein
MALVNVLSLSRALTLILCHFSPVRIYMYIEMKAESWLLLKNTRESWAI